VDEFVSVNFDSLMFNSYEQEKEKFEEDRQSLLQKMSKGMSFEEYLNVCLA
jgi:hypothetical protein